MPACTLCGRSVVPFFSAHLRCKRVNRAGRAELVALADRQLASGGVDGELPLAVERLEREAFVTREQRGELLRTRFEQRVREALEDSVVTVDEEAQLLEFTEAFALGRDELDHDGWYTRFVQSAALRDLLHGKLPPSVLPMALEPGDALIWMFPTAQLTEGAVLRKLHDSSSVQSIPVSHGLYYRIAEPQPERRERTVQRPIDAGSLGVTNRYVHFSGLRIRFRLPLEELDQLEPTKQGVTFRRAVGGKSEGFETGDGWFLMNLLSNARNARSA
jgi:hypothetical protein